MSRGEARSGGLALTLALICAACGPAEPPGGAERPVEPAASGLRRAAGGSEGSRAGDEPAHAAGEVAPDHVLARVGDRAITAGDLAAAIERMDGPARARFMLPRHRRELLRRMVRDELLAQEAERRGLGAEPTVALAERRALARAVAERVRLELQGVEPPIEALRARYEAQPGRWRRPARVELRVLALEDGEEAQALLERLHEAQLRKALDKEFVREAERLLLSGGVPFPIGLVGPCVREEEARAGLRCDLPAPVVEAAFATPAGELGERPVEHEGAYYLVYVQRREPSSRVSWEAARPILEAEWRRERLRQRLAELVEEVVREEGLQVDRAALRDVRLPQSLGGSTR